MGKDKDIAPPGERAQQILRALIRHYIRDGQPVGSRTLSRDSGLGLSPATIRNVMSDLEELGFIAAPHTSAGRVPTARGYRFFVDTLVKLRPVDGRAVSQLQRQLEEEMRDSGKSLAESASSALSSLTSMAGLVTIPRQTHVTLRRVDFVRLSEARVLAILVVNDAEVQNRIVHLDRDYSDNELNRAANYLNDKFQGKDLHEMREGLVGELARTRETMNQMMIDTVSLAQQALDVSQQREQYIISGQTKLMDFQELSDIERLKRLFEAFNQQREILRLLDRSIAAEGVQIFIGEESGYQMLDECSLVTAPYTVDDEVVGVLGVIGPTRMAYDRVIPIVDITAKLVGAALNSSQ